MSNLAANECRRQLRYNYLDAERIEKAKGLAEALNRYGSTEAELARIKKDYGARLDTIQAEIDLLNGCVLSGYELREYLCFWEYDQPRAGRKTLRKREGGEVVGEEDMTERDRQMVIEIIESQAVAANEKPVLAIAPPVNLPTTVIEVSLDDGEISSFDFDDDVCRKFGELVHEVFVILPEGGGESTLRDEQGRDVAISLVLNRETDTCLGGFAKWLREDTRKDIAGLSWLADAVEAYLKGLEIQRQAAKARSDAEKKKNRSGRRAGSAGTVDVPADEGSRDDAGSESKTNL